MTKTKKIVLATASGVVLLSLIGALLAYFGTEDKEANIVGIGEDDITVTEVFTPPSQTQDFFYRKLVKIENTGSVPCYIRVRLELSNTAVQNAASFSADLRDTAPEADPDTQEYQAFLETFKKASIPDNTTDTSYYINSLPDGWVYVWDENPVDPDVTHGYYYYTKAVPPEESTNALISWVRMNYNGAEIQAHDVYVYAESVQTVKASDGTNYADIENGWIQAWHDFAG